jgi:ubiquinone/menaquinone biosynthesis C-methylase UbiE
MILLDALHGHHVYKRRVQILAGHLATRIPRDATVLDVGCGDGHLARLALRRRPDIRITGIDVLVRRTTQIPVVAFDGRTLPYPDRSFDVVMFVDILHHAEDPRGLLREGARVARQSVLIKDHTVSGFLARPTLRLMDWVGNARYRVALPYNYWTRDQWDTALATLGLSLADRTVQLRLYRAPLTWFFDRSLHFVARLDRRP